MNPLCFFHPKHQIKILFLDFDGVFTDNTVLIDENGQEYVTCTRSDGFGLSRLNDHSILPIVITTETKPLARQRCLKLGIICFDSVEDKYLLASKVLEENNLSFTDAAFVGNDINDLSLLSKVALPIVTPDCHLSVRKSTFYVTTNCGGRGCVREICDFLCS